MGCSNGLFIVPVLFCCLYFCKLVKQKHDRFKYEKEKRKERRRLCRFFLLLVLLSGFNFIWALKHFSFDILCKFSICLGFDVKRQSDGELWGFIL